MAGDTTTVEFAVVDIERVRLGLSVIALASVRLNISGAEIQLYDIALCRAGERIGCEMPSRLRDGRQL